MSDCGIGKTKKECLSEKEAQVYSQGGGDSLLVPTAMNHNYLSDPLLDLFEFCVLMLVLMYMCTMYMYVLCMSGAFRHR